jgi:hypothetical protein
MIKLFNKRFGHSCSAVILLNSCKTGMKEHHRTGDISDSYLLPRDPGEFAVRAAMIETDLGRVLLPISEGQMNECKGRRKAPFLPVNTSLDPWGSCLLQLVYMLFLMGLGSLPRTDALFAAGQQSRLTSRPLCDQCAKALCSYQD